MNILITGSNGFVAKNLISELKNQGIENLLLVDRSTTDSDLQEYVTQSDYVFHLAGVNRPENDSEFVSGNVDFTQKLVSLLEQTNRNIPLVISSSTQASHNNPYGNSKNRGEQLVKDYAEKTGSRVLIYRFPNIFGKWSRPNYNSAIATFCYNISRDIPITVNNRETLLELVYIDDVVKELINGLSEKESRHEGYCFVPTTYKQTLGNIVDKLENFKESRKSLVVPNMGDDFTRKLYSTYLSFLAEDNFSYMLKMNEDNRGSFTEFLRTTNAGQVSINVSKPDIVKGNHWHHTKNEKFLVVSGQGVIRFRKPNEDEVIEYFVSGERLEVVDIPVGYTHNIENLGQHDMVTVMWVNEPFNPNEPDTYFLEV